MTSKKINEHVNSFLHNLKILVKEAYIVLPNNPNIYRANKRIHLLITLDPKMIIEKVGEKLFKYKDLIYNPNIDQIAHQLTFSEDIDPDSADLATLLISEITTCITTLTSNQKEFFRNILTDLLDDYLEYKVLITSS